MLAGTCRYGVNMKYFGVLLGLCVSIHCWGLSNQQCVALVYEVKSMQIAQSKLLQSMIDKDLMLARSLELQAQNVEKNKVFSKTLVMSLKRSATNLKDHHKNEQKIIDRYEALSNRIYTNVLDCLVRLDLNKDLGLRNQLSGL
jgi:hypothetical protein